MDESYVINEMTGLPHPVNTEVFEAHQAWIESKLTFENYARFAHNPTSIASALVYQSLMNTMDEARAYFGQYKNEWYIAKMGYSLN